MKAAAVFLIVFVSSYLLIQYTKSIPVEMKEIVVNKSVIDNLTLADGTQIKLDAGSTFRFPAVLHQLLSVPSGRRRT